MGLPSIKDKVRKWFDGFEILWDTLFHTFREYPFWITLNSSSYVSTCLWNLTTFAMFDDFSLLHKYCIVRGEKPEAAMEKYRKVTSKRWQIPSPSYTSVK